MDASRNGAGGISGMRGLASMLFLAATATVAGCGGGGGSPSPPGPPPGSGMPVESGGDQSTRIAEILARTDSVLATRVHGERRELPPPPPTTLPPPPSISNPPVEVELERVDFVVDTSCEGSICTADGGDGSGGDGVPERFDRGSLDWITRFSEARWTRNGVTLVEGRSDVREPSPETPDHLNFGAWMDHSGFVFRMGLSVEDGFETRWRYGLAGGDLTGSRPSPAEGMELVWKGVMVGSVGRERVRLQGDATLTYDAGLNELDAEFSEIVNLEKAALYSVPYLRFDDVLVAVEGTFEAGIGGNRIQGGFYGPAHKESVGTFEQLGIVGAFGARRQGGS